MRSTFHIKAQHSCIMRSTFHWLCFCLVHTTLVQLTTPLPKIYISILKENKYEQICIDPTQSLPCACHPWSSV
jgi:hypothetical protein